MFADALSDRIQVSCVGEETLFVLVEANCHHPVGVVEGLLDPISMVHINIEIEHSRVELEELEDAEDDVVDVAEATSILSFGMVEASHPIDHNISLACYDQISSVDAAASCQLTVVVESFEARAIKPMIDFELLPQLEVRLHQLQLSLASRLEGLDDLGGVGVDPGLQVLDVGGMVVLAQLFECGLFAMISHKAIAEAVGVDEAIDHFEPHWLHGVLLAEIEVGELLVVEVGNSSHLITRVSCRAQFIRLLQIEMNSK